MKIVFITDAWKPLVGGGQNLFWHLTNGLVKNHRCQITVVTRALKYKGKIYNQHESYLNNRLKIIRLGPAFDFFNPLARFSFIFRPFFYCLKNKPDLYLASTWLPALTIQLMKPFTRIPKALIVIGFGASNRIYQFLEILISRILKYDLIISDDYTYCQTNQNIHFIPNGVTIPILPPKSFKKWSQFTFLTIARDEPRKGIQVLLKAFRRLQKQFPQTKLRLFGPGHKMISQKQLNKEFLKAHCLVLPSLAEGHPLVLFEAWAHHLPVIATDVGTVGRFVNSDNGYLIPANNWQSLLKAMKLAIKNPNLSVMGQKGYQLVSHHYSWLKTIKKYYQALLSVSRQ